MVSVGTAKHIITDDGFMLARTCTDTVLTDVLYCTVSMRIPRGLMRRPADFEISPLHSLVTAL